MFCLSRPRLQLASSAFVELEALAEIVNLTCCFDLTETPCTRGASIERGTFCRVKLHLIGRRR
jgi:hypothetical protein